MIKEARQEMLGRFLKESYHDFVETMIPWAERTNQPIFFPKGYFGQIVVSLVTGIKGSASAARGDDLEDGSEVKTSARLLQLNHCKACLRKTKEKTSITCLAVSCPICGATGNDIEIMRDSHFIMNIDPVNLEDYLGKIPTIYVLLIDDYQLKSGKPVTEKSNNSEKYYITGKQMKGTLTIEELKRVATAARFTIWSIEPAKNKIWKDAIKTHFNRTWKKNPQGKWRKINKSGGINVHPRSPKFFGQGWEKIFEGVLDEKGKLNIFQFP